MSQLIVLAYNGDFETTVAIRWLAKTYDASVVTVTLDLGQRRDPAEARERALAAGAVRAHVLDVREEFARNHILPALQSGAFGVGQDADVLALAWPLIAGKLVEIATLEGATGVAHGSMGRMIDAEIAVLSPGLTVIAPARNWRMTRAELVEWARDNSVPVLVSDRSYKVEQSLLGRAVTWQADADNQAPPADVRRYATLPATAADTTAFVELTFEHGTPVAINGVRMSLPELLESVTVIAGQLGVGRSERVTTDASGAMTRVVYDAPAVVVLHAAYASRDVDIDAETNTVRLKLSGGHQTVVPALLPELVAHA